MNPNQTAEQQLDRELARAISLAPLDARFDAAVLARIEALPQGQPIMFEAGRLQQLLAREQRRMRVLVGAYGLGAAAVLVAVANVASHAKFPALSLLPPVTSLSVPIAALAVLGAGAWMIARDKVSSILSI